MKIGVIGRADPTGLGTMTMDFCRHIDVSKAYILNCTSRGPTDVTKVKCDNIFLEDEILPKTLAAFLDGLDVVVGFETFYSEDVIVECEKRGIKSVIFPMWECSPDYVAAAHFIMAVTTAELARFPKSHWLQWPMESHWKWEPERTPRVFACNGGSLGLHDRNNFAAAAMAVRDGALNGTDAVLHYRCHDISYAQMLAGNHPKIKVFPPAAERDDLYNGVDCVIHLQAFGGLSLPILEARALGVPVITLNVPGFEMNPMRCKIADDLTGDYEIGGRMIRYCRPDVDCLGDMMRVLANGSMPLIQSPSPLSFTEFKASFYQILGQ